MVAPLNAIIDDDWATALQPVAGQVAAMGDFLRAEVAAGRRYLPAGPLVLRAFERPMRQVRVLIVGQDPYPTPGHPIGLSFAVERHVRPLPRSLGNIYKELRADTGIVPPAHGDWLAAHIPNAMVDAHDTAGHTGDDAEVERLYAWLAGEIGDPSAST